MRYDNYLWIYFSSNIFILFMQNYKIKLMLFASILYKDNKDIMGKSSSFNKNSFSLFFSKSFNFWIIKGMLNVSVIY
jgi:hypothetical protein